MQSTVISSEEAPSERQQAVLDAVLSLLVEQGHALTMTAVARRASCSKETLYKWYGDRDGLLTATVRWQASKVRAGNYDAQHLDSSTLRESLQGFAVNWLTVISSRTSVALNRVAVGGAGSGRDALGAIVLANGRFAIGERLKPVLEAGRTAGLLAFDDAEEAFRTFFGLVGRDVQIRLLLGDDMALDAAEIEADARRATNQFFALYGRGSFEAPLRSAPQDEERGGSGAQEQNSTDLESATSVRERRPSSS
ncbi:TetR family transcriptional regulator [Tianweitania populi]|uniref:TetR family transcriptional regulator n=1 Tax=Tianweitania populi TaxID=1607949 RepID=A0A8J3DP20_9HYPH|nr:TetR family transcriptional regulator [Tianweitania populi]